MLEGILTPIFGDTITVAAFSIASASGDSALDYDGTGAYEGGTFLAVGMSGMAQGFNSGTYVSFGSLGMMGGGRGGAFEIEGTRPEMSSTRPEMTGTPPEMGGIPAEKQNGTREQRQDFQAPGGQSEQGASAFTIASGSSIVIKNSAGNTLYTATGMKTANSVIFADDSLVSGQEYTLYIDGGQVAAATAATGSSTVSPFRFVDVGSNRWYYNDVYKAYEKNMMKGSSSTFFNPDANITRAMLVQILYNLEGNPEVDADTAFNDVKTGTWYEDAVNWAVKEGIVFGVDDNRFGSDDILTREQMAVLLHRYAVYKNYDSSETADLSKYGDSGDISQYAQEAMKWANAAGLIVGTDKEQLLPGGKTTRAQAASILVRFNDAF